MKPITTRNFGKTVRSVTMVGLGGEGILRTYGRTQQAAAMIQAAIEQGVTYFDCAHNEFDCSPKLKVFSLPSSQRQRK